MADDPLSPAEIAGSALPGILSRARVVVTPYPFGVSDADRLRVTVFNAVAGVVVNIHGRQVAPGADAKPFDLQLTPTSDRQATFQDFVLGGGFVTNLTCFASGVSTVQVGQTFVIVQLIRGIGGAAFLMGTLLQGYVTTRQALGWPGSPIQTSTEGEPAVRNVSGTLPAPGGQCIEFCPVGARWEVITFCTDLVTSAVAGARQVAFQINHGGLPGTIALQTVLPLQGASSSAFYTFSQNIPPTNSSNFAAIPFPARQFMTENEAILVNALGLDPGDQFSRPVYQVREWLLAA